MSKTRIGYARWLDDKQGPRRDSAAALLDLDVQGRSYPTLITA